MTDSNNYSVLQHCTESQVYHEPFPHVVIKNALPQAICDQLIEEYPPFDVLGVNPDQNNKRWSYEAPRVMDNPNIGACWKQFVAYHRSIDFFREVLELFGEDLQRLHPRTYKSASSKDPRVGVRGLDSFANKDFLLDAQISGNTPVIDAGSVKTTHVDSPNKLFSGLFYLRHPNDDSTGGELEIRRFRKGYEGQKIARCFDGVFVDDRFTEIVNTVPYGANTLVLFVNGVHALHGVSIRHPTPYPRRFLNLVCEVKKPLFRVPMTPTTRLRRFRNTVAKRVQSATTALPG